MGRRGPSAARGALRAGLVAVPLAFALLLSGCAQSQDVRGASTPAAGTSSTAPSSAPSAAHREAGAPGACTLLDQHQAEALAGAPLAAPEERPESCLWAAADVNGPTRQVEVFVGPGARGQLESDRVLGHSLEAIDGLGDEGWQSDSTAYVRRGEYWVSVHVVRLEDPAAYRQALVDAAHAAAGRI